MYFILGSLQQCLKFGGANVALKVDYNNEDNPAGIIGDESQTRSLIFDILYHVFDEIC